jgi:hypothetical protein
MTMKRAALIAAFVCGIGVIIGAEQLAIAQPWSQGVSEKQKADAKVALDEGNRLYLATEYKTAAEKYELALKSWNHPAIRFNYVRSLVQLGRNAEAGDNLQQALQYGKEPFTDEVYQEVLSYQKLLANQFGEIEVGCKQDGAKLTFDGKPFIEKCPGKQKARVAPGKHAVVATADGFMTKEMPVIVIGGAQQNVDVELVPLDKAAKVVHRWPTWIPWVVFGSGLAVAGFGVLLEVDARGQMSDYDQQVAIQCATMGCDLRNPMPGSIEESLVNQREGAESRDRLAVGVIAVGAVGAAIGGVMLFMNRGRTVYEDPTGKDGPVVNVTPTRDGGGMVTLGGRF